MGLKKPEDAKERVGGDGLGGDGAEVTRREELSLRNLVVL